MKRKIMNKKVIGLMLWFVTLFSVLGINAATAEQKEMYCQGMVCSETPPSPSETGVFAIVDPVTNNVVAVIPGNIAYFGKNDKTIDGEYQNCPSGCKIILQAMSDPLTGNVVGAISNETTKVTYSPTENSFKVEEGGSVTKVISAPIVTTTESSTVISTVDVSFSVNSSVNSAKVSTTEITVAAPITTIIQESLTFSGPTTQENVIDAIDFNQRNLMKSRIARILKAMGDWLI
jgi:predicted secreted protein